MDKFLGRLKPAKFNQEEIVNMNRPITSEETALVIKNYHKGKPVPDGFTSNSAKYLKNN